MIVGGSNFDEYGSTDKETYSKKVTLLSKRDYPRSNSTQRQLETKPFNKSVLDNITGRRFVTPDRVGGINVYKDHIHNSAMNVSSRFLPEILNNS